LSPLDSIQTGLSQGIYNVKVTDSNDCDTTWSYTLTQPEMLVTSIVPKTISCFNINNGSADLTVSGGVEDYTYLWSNGEITQDLSALFTGKYYVDITDANNCFASDTTIVTEPPDIIVNLDVPLQYNSKMISCFGASDATINSEVTGGAGDFSYNWNPNGEQTPGLNNVPVGLYYLTVTDENLCTEVDSIEVEQPLKLKTEVYETNPTCFGKADGSITLIVQGGTPQYTINWNIIEQQGPTAENIGDGRYNVTITDLNQCKIDTFGTLIQPESILLEKIEVINPTCPDIYDGLIHYNIEGGTIPYDLLLNNVKVDELITDLREGTYILDVTDYNQCSISDTTVLDGTSPLCVHVPNAFTPNADGENDTWIIDKIEIYPNVKIEIYNRWGELIYYAPKGYTKPWDGTYNGRELPIDSYFYVIDLNNGGDAVTGNITIIR
jgi:gliding motility-associated-like protein